VSVCLAGWLFVCLAGCLSVVWLKSFHLSGPSYTSGGVSLVGLCQTVSSCCPVVLTERPNSIIIWNINELGFRYSCDQFDPGDPINLPSSVSLVENHKGPTFCLLMDLTNPPGLLLFVTLRVSVCFFLPLVLFIMLVQWACMYFHSLVVGYQCFWQVFSLLPFRVFLFFVLQKTAYDV